MPLRSDQAIIENVLEKRSPRAIGGWQKRRFQLFETLICYGKPTKDKNTGQIPIDSILAVQIVRNKGKGRRFDITLDGRKFQLLAPTSDKCSEWVEHIQKLVESARQQGKQFRKRETKKFWKVSNGKIDESAIDSAEALMTTSSSGSGAFTSLCPEPTDSSTYNSNNTHSRNSSSRGSAHSGGFTKPRSNSTFLENVHSGARPPIMSNGTGHSSPPTPIHTQQSLTNGHHPHPSPSGGMSPRAHSHSAAHHPGYAPQQQQQPSPYVQPSPQPQYSPHPSQQMGGGGRNSYAGGAPPTPHDRDEHRYREEMGQHVPPRGNRVATAPFEELKSEQSVLTLNDLTVEDEVQIGRAHV